LLSLHAGNKRLSPAPGSGYEFYQAEREKAQQSLAFVKNIPGIATSLEKMPDYMNNGYNSSLVRLAHEIGNLTNRHAIFGVEENLRRNPNSIQTFGEHLSGLGLIKKHLRIVSPYYFVARYFNKEGEQVLDGAKEIHDWLDQNPDSKIELITNSVLTSDNFIAQSVIDMDTAPRLLLSPKLRERWLASQGEFDPDLVESEEWKQMVNNPRVLIYETGGNDAVFLGGNEHYGKLHAKYVIADGLGFIGTTNFDYRSLLFNNELGFYFKGQGTYDDLDKIFEQLKRRSYRWGTPEWLEMRKRVMAQKGIKARTTRMQRAIFKLIRGTRLEWLF